MGFAGVAEGFERLSRGFQKGFKALQGVLGCSRRFQEILRVIFSVP